ncbi:hypothetical protein AX16_010729 [Volvariella volvacea WC 439]|nr:hypothetical protein AX16_010729 [Volvariella volvacea WC 439]
MAVLPIELIEHIIDFIGSSKDTKTLNSCALASPQLLPITRSHRYSSIHIHYYRDIIPLQKFACLLRTFPDVANHVQSFTFGDWDYEYRPDDPQRPKPTLWKFVDEDSYGDDNAIRGDLPSVLSALKRLKLLHLLSRCPVNYSILSDPLKRVLAQTLRLPTFYTLQLTGLVDISPILFSSRKITALRMESCTIAHFPITRVGPESPTTQSDDFQPRTVYINDLHLAGESDPHRTLENVLDFFVHPACPLNFDSLQHLVVQAVDGTESARVMKIINQCSQSLESFVFSAPEYSSNSLQSISLSGLINLNHLELKTIITFQSLPILSDEDKLFPGPIIPIASILSTLPGLSHLSADRHASSSRIPSIQASTPPDVARTINFRLRAWERFDDLLLSIITANEDRHGSEGFQEPVVKMRCRKEISVKSLRTRCPKSFGTGRMEVIIEEY